MSDPRVVPVMVSNRPNDVPEDKIAEATVALDFYGGVEGLKRRGHTFDEYMAGKIPGFTPEILVRRYESEEPWRA